MYCSEVQSDQVLLHTGTFNMRAASSTCASDTCTNLTRSHSLNCPRLHLELELAFFHASILAPVAETTIRENKGRSEPQLSGEGGGALQTPPPCPSRGFIIKTMSLGTQF